MQQEPRPPLTPPPGLDASQMATSRTSAQFLLCGQLERHLKQLLQKHKFFDPPVREARLRLRNAYVAVLLGDYALSQVGSATPLHRCVRPSASAIQLC